jgi:hypothetical protein
MNFVRFLAKLSKLKVVLENPKLVTAIRSEGGPLEMFP